jgi:hypothetical protein
MGFGVERRVPMRVTKASVMSRPSRLRIWVALAWGVGVAVVIACTAPVVHSPDDSDPDAASAEPSVDVRGGGDADGEAPHDGGDPRPSRAIWAFSGVCGSAIAAACPAITDCPAPDGGLAATDCPTPLAHCLQRQSDEAGIADRVFTCESVAGPVWDLDQLCSVESCGPEVVTCSSFDGGVAGQPCTTPLARCHLNQGTFTCQPAGEQVYLLNGYCDAGKGSPACGAGMDACTRSALGVSGSVCATAFERCLSGDKIFVCAPR